jgi:hypothetical protein
LLVSLEAVHPAAEEYVILLGLLSTKDRRG